MRRIKEAEIVDLMRKRQGERTAKELADELGVSPQHISDIYLGRRFPGRSFLQRLGVEKRIVYVLASRREP